MKTKQMKKRIMSMILALVIGICCIVPAAPAMKTEAATLKDVAKKIDMNAYNQITLKKEKREVVLKIVLPSKAPSIDISISLKKKKSIQLGAIFNNCSKKKLIWKSSKKKVATVTSKGKVTAKKKVRMELQLLDIQEKLKRL